MVRTALLHLIPSQAHHHHHNLLKSTNFHSGPHLSRLCALLQTSGASSAIQPTAIQRRWLSTEGNDKISIGPQKGGDSGKDEKDSSVVYYGPISNTIKKVKLLSLSTCCLSVSLGPVITFMTSPDMNVILKGAVASSVIR